MAKTELGVCFVEMQKILQAEWSGFVVVQDVFGYDVLGNGKRWHFLEGIAMFTLWREFNSSRELWIGRKRFRWLHLLTTRNVQKRYDCTSPSSASQVQFGWCWRWWGYRGYEWVACVVEASWCWVLTVVKDFTEKKSRSQRWQKLYVDKCGRQLQIATE